MPAPPYTKLCTYACISRHREGTEPTAWNGQVISSRPLVKNGCAVLFDVENAIFVIADIDLVILYGRNG